MLIDTPGLDSGSDEYRKDGLAHSLAYLLIFPADESVVKESAAAVLAELKLRDAPVYGVLTKCDKVPPEEVGNSMRYLQGQLERLLGRPSVPLVCASTRTPGGTSRVETLLLGFQERADEIARHRFTAQLLDRGFFLLAVFGRRAAFTPAVKQPSFSLLLISFDPVIYLLVGDFVLLAGLPVIQPVSDAI